MTVLHAVSSRAHVGADVTSESMAEPCRRARTGWSTKLNPDIRIMERLKEMLPMDWRERMSRTVDKLVAADVEV